MNNHDANTQISFTLATQLLNSLIEGGSAQELRHTCSTLLDHDHTDAHYSTAVAILLAKGLVGLDVKSYSSANQYVATSIGLARGSACLQANLEENKIFFSGVIV
jgi:hypothetical protein